MDPKFNHDGDEPRAAGDQGAEIAAWAPEGC